MNSVILANEEPRATLHLVATAFNREQLTTQLDLLRAEECPQIALAGRSNVGKSSLINALAGNRKLAKTSSTPGKTRSVNFYRVQPDNFCLVDLPGYGYARCSQEERRAWAKLIERYLDECQHLAGLALLLDCRLTPQPLDKELAAFAQAKRLHLLPILTKADKCKQAERAERQKAWAALLDGAMPLPVSAADGRGIAALWQALRQRVAESGLSRVLDDSLPEHEA